VRYAGACLCHACVVTIILGRPVRPRQTCDTDARKRNGADTRKNPRRELYEICSIVKQVLGSVLPFDLARCDSGGLKYRHEPRVQRRDHEQNRYVTRSPKGRPTNSQTRNNAAETALAPEFPCDPTWQRRICLNARVSANGRKSSLGSSIANMQRTAPDQPNQRYAMASTAMPLRTKSRPHSAPSCPGARITACDIFFGDDGHHHCRTYVATSLLLRCAHDRLLSRSVT
jgi:hypothetical protein